MTRRELPRTPGGSPDDLPLLFDADANNEMEIQKWVFVKYLRNQKRYDCSSFDKNVHLDMIHQEHPKTQGGSPPAEFRVIQINLVSIHWCLTAAVASGWRSVIFGCLFCIPCQHFWNAFQL